jgi:hypothetical protein
MGPKKPADIVVIGISPHRTPEDGQRLAVPAGHPDEVTERIDLGELAVPDDTPTIDDEDELFRAPAADDPLANARALGPLLGGPESC